MGLKDTLRSGGVPRFIFIGCGVICLHAAALWLLSIDTGQAPHRTPPFVLLTPPPLPPSPAMAPTATKSARPTTHTEKAPRTKKPATELAIPAARPVAATPAQDTPPTATPNDRSMPALAVPPANLPMQAADRNAMTAGAGSVPDSDKTTASIQLPSTNADYLNNPAPVYPPLSQRLGEQGKVVIRILIGKDGTALRGNIHQSSGFERLDQAALRAVMSWRYLPGQRAGVAQDMWFNVPVNFSLN